MSATIPEFNFNDAGASSRLITGPGVVGNGDGTLPPVSQSAGGLELQVSIPVTDAGSSYGRTNNADGTTIFYDTTLVLTGLTADQNAIAAGSLDIQHLGAGTFSFYGSKSGGGLGALLLQGAFNDTSILGSGSVGAILDSTTTYTAGSIYNQLILQGGSTTGDASSSISLIGSTFSISGDHHLSSFAANATGTFDVAAVPEPASAALLGVASILLLARRRRRA